MHDLIPLTPLGDTAPRVDTVGGLTLTEVTDIALTSVSERAGRRADCARALTQWIGAPVPDVQKAVSGARFSAFWMGPGKWMLAADHGSDESLPTDVKAALGDCASVTEQTDAWCIFDLKGARINAVLERLCNIDLNRLAAGDALWTSVDHLRCLVLCEYPGAALRIFGPRSSAGSLHHAILTAMTSSATPHADTGSDHDDPLGTGAN